MMRGGSPWRVGKLIGGLVVMAGLTGIIGCGQPETGEETEEDQVSVLVDEVADAAGETEAFQALFADGAAPPEEKQPEYHKLMFFATDISISGDTAEIAVRVEDFNNNPKGEVTWKAKRQGQGWVLTDAPLP